ncbi:MAG: biotin--[acetyl-CoA-carboxylase] ligase [Acidimicrobiales bacterium]|nr:biotin--[acetyl-CoA-carboxylase] ligase [Acidimicrobiales bacterium]
MSGPAHPIGDEFWSQQVLDASGTPTRFRVETVLETGSTNADLVLRASTGEPDGLVLRADYQTAGRGRLDRKWDAPASTNLLFSVLHRSRLPVERLSLVTSCLAMSLVDALEPLLAPTTVAKVKWPNDVLLVEQVSGVLRGKVAGVLAELVAETQADAPAVVAGMGVNVAWPKPEDHAPPDSISLMSAGIEVEPASLLEKVLQAFDIYLTQLAGSDGPDAIRDSHRERSATVGCAVRIKRRGVELVGTAVDLGIDGSLVVTSIDGSTTEVLAGDVTHLRVV